MKAKMLVLTHKVTGVQMSFLIDMEKMNEVLHRKPMHPGRQGGPNEGDHQ